MTAEALVSQGYEQLWSALDGRGWRSIALVPAASRGSTAGLAAALAEAGERLGGEPVTVASAPSPEDGYERVLADLRRQGPPPASGTPRDGGPEGAAPRPRLIVSVPGVLEEPRALAVAQAADAVVLAVEVGRTRLADARRSIALIGPERIAGCFLAT